MPISSTAYPPADDAGAPMMLPLTQSLYVEGELADADKVLVDIGTGYYLQVCRVFVCSSLPSVIFLSSKCK